MRKSTNRMLIALVSALFAVATFSTAHATYPLDAVIAACERAYDNGQQIDQCIMNVCGHYGCDGW